MTKPQTTPGRTAPTGPTAQDVRSQLSAYISEKGLKKSRQRDAIAAAFFATPGHVSAEELVARVRSVERQVSVATVYRTLKLLGESGLASPRDFGDGQTRWESAVGRSHHDHLVCTRCGEIVEFLNEEIELIQARVARQHGFEVESHRLELYGACGRCGRGRGRKKSEARP